MDITIKTALISVSDKTGVVDFARALAQMGVKIISTGGTARTLTEAGAPEPSPELYSMLIVLRAMVCPGGACGSSKLQSALAASTTLRASTRKTASKPRPSHTG